MLGLKACNTISDYSYILVEGEVTTNDFGEANILTFTVGCVSPKEMIRNEVFFFLDLDNFK